jgi:hypothetical protein
MPTIKIGIIGSQIYENKKKIRDMIFKIKQSLGDDVEIVSGGCPSGADKYAKKYALEMGLKYKEFNPAHTVPNLYSACAESYYNKPYHVSQFFHRNDLLVKYCDKIIGFIHSEAKTKGSMYTINAAKKSGKPVVILDEKA